MDPISTHAEEVTKKLQMATANLVRHSNQIPQLGDGYELYASYSDFNQFMHQQRARILNSLHKLYSTAGCRIRLAENELDCMHQLACANDTLAERIARSMDEHQTMLTKNRIKAHKISLGAENIGRSDARTSTKSSAGFEDCNSIQQSKSGYGKYSVLATKTNVLSTSLPLMQSSSQVTQKPQRAFYHCINNRDAPFVPKLRVKHNAIERVRGQNRIPNLRIVVNGVEELNVSDGDSSWMDSGGTRGAGISSEHPYGFELENFELNDDRHLKIPECVKQKPAPLDQTPLRWVQQRDELVSLVEELNNTPEFAFDLEHNATRSFLGLTCLLQISTRDCDYIVDPFPIWEHMHLLNDPFTNPNIVKVAFSPEADVLWLQRDFGIYVVGLFDTRQASARIKGAEKGINLGKLVSEICGIELNKGLATADWRLRPLPSAMVVYARSDTHYLLACSDHLKGELVRLPSLTNSAQTALHDIFVQSAQISGLLFEQPRFNSFEYKKLLRGRRFNNQQMAALEALWRWRDKMARDNDESLHYVLPTHMMLQIAEVLPREASGVLACCAPVPPLVRIELGSLNRIILHAREISLERHPQPALLPHQQNADDVLSDPLLEANRITALRAKLDYRFDCSLALRMNEEQRSAESGVTKNTAKFMHEFNSTSRDSNGENGEWRQKSDRPARHCILVVDGDEQQLGNRKQRRERVRTTLDRWASPFDTYLVALRENEERRRRGEDDERGGGEREVKPDETAMHGSSTGALSPDVGERASGTTSVGPEVKVEPCNEEERPMDSEDRAFFADPANLTKRARKRRMDTVARESKRV